MADLLPEKWMKVMAVTTTFFGVVASAATSRASFFITQSQLNIAIGADQWSYYQAKTIKQDLYATRIKYLEYKELGAVTPQQKMLLDQSIQQYAADISRYEKEKAEIGKRAQEVRKKNITVAHESAQFSLAVVFAQLAILLSGVAVLLKLRRLWILGIGVGLISIFFIANGFFLFFKF